MRRMVQHYPLSLVIFELQRISTHAIHRIAAHSTHINSMIQSFKYQAKVFKVQVSK
jgi:hypothetical protein